MAGTINVAGHKVSKNEALLLGLVAVGVVIVAVMRKKSANAAAAAAAGSSAGAGQFTDPAGNVCAAPDPSTGYCPGTPEDISAQEQLSASSTDYGLDSGGSLGGSTGEVANNSVPVFTDNGAWGQYVEQMLGSDGTDATAAAIAKYLSGQSVTEAQQTTIEQAIAIANYPPVAGSGGFPPSVNLSASSPAPAPAATQVTVPNVVGMRAAAQALPALTAAGFKYHTSPVINPAHEYTVSSQTPGAGKKAAAGSTVDLGLKQIS
jgi:hypothetical protein